MVKKFNYKALEIEYFESRNAKIAVRTIGVGPPLIFVHGWPVHGYTWRFLIPKLSAHFKCYILDMPGLGDSQWSKQTDFNWVIQAKRLLDFIRHYQLKNFSMIGNDTGGSIVRIAAIELDEEIKTTLKNLILINTEMPNHRPPFIPFYQFAAKLPLAKMTFRMLLHNKRWISSRFGFKGFYSDKNLLNHPDYIMKPYIQPALKDTKQLAGVLEYLKGCDMTISDTFDTRHSEIKANVLLVWGEDCPVFPVEMAREMTKQFNHGSFRTIPRACFMPHEEKPNLVFAEIAKFLKLEAFAQ